MNKVVILIPARLESTRFPGKPLVKIKGKEMIIRVIERSLYDHDVFAVVNNKSISDLVRNYGYKDILIEEECSTGTDRIALAAKKLNLAENDIIVNVQGDEPLIMPWMIEKVLKTKKENPNFVVNAFSKISTEEEFLSKSTIKIVVNNNSNLLFASRLNIPSSKNKINLDFARKQVCIYAFSFLQLEKFSITKKGPIESKEDIEILRFIENNIYPVKMVDLGNIKLKAVDNPEDVFEVEKYLEN
tara:strand:- start:1598 stop:2329 length:732 start_codon:yes stop_codon:yes gene_type:complete